MSYDFAKAHITNSIKSILQGIVYCPCLTAILKYREHRQLENMHVYSSAKILTILVTRVNRVHNSASQACPSKDFLPRSADFVYLVTNVCGTLEDLIALSTLINRPPRGTVFFTVPREPAPEPTSGSARTTASLARKHVLSMLEFYQTCEQPTDQGCTSFIEQLHKDIKHHAASSPPF